MDTYVGRFAPSPTGPLHLGSLVAALASWLDARHHAGRWLLRIEDLDPPRALPGASDAILRALDALGLGWDGEVLHQHTRDLAYRDALEHLRRRRAAYPCSCSRKAIAERQPQQGPEGAVYPGICRRGLARPGRAPAWRVATDAREIAFDDRILGPQVIALGRDLGDFVVRRADRLWAYHLAVVVDDAFQGVTQVVRGCDLLLSTARHHHLQALLGLPTPGYAHVPVILGADGRKLSKQTGAEALDLTRPGELLAQALARLGQPVASDAADDPAALLARAAQDWDIGRVARRRSRPAQATD